MGWLSRGADELLNSWGGVFGVDLISDTDTHTGVWNKLVAKGDVSINALTSNWSTSPTTLADGEAIYGRFTSIDLSSGTLYCYRDKTHGE